MPVGTFTGIQCRGAKTAKARFLPQYCESLTLDPPDQLPRPRTRVSRHAHTTSGDSLSKAVSKE